MKMHSEIIEAEENLEGSIREDTNSKALRAEAMLAETKRRKKRRKKNLPKLRICGVQTPAICIC